MKNWSQLILQKMPDKISASQFLLVLLTLDSNLYHIFYTISFYTIIVQKNRTLFHKLFPELLEQGIRSNTIRLSVGTENIDDIIQDLEEAFKAVQ